MSVTTRNVTATVDETWAVLADGWLYPLWVVGATRMRGVDPTWPEVGSRLHHSAGTWPLVLDDTTEVLEVEPGRRLVLQARGWPLGEARVVLDLAPVDEGRGTRITIEETAVSGPGVLMPEPLERLMLGARNREALQRLAFVVEGRR